MSPRTWRLGALLAIPFVFVAIATHRAVPRAGDWIARHVIEVASAFRGHPAPAPRDEPQPSAAADGPLPEEDPGPDSPDGGPSADGVPRKPGAKAHPAAGSSTPATPSGPLSVHVPAALVQRAIDEAGAHIRAKTTRGADGKPAGIRLTGVSGLGIGLRDGDVIVAVEGKPTMNDDVATDAALAAIARGATVLHATLMRGDQRIDVTLELPLAPLAPVAAPDAGKAR